MHGKTTGEYRNEGTGQGIRIIFNFQRAKVQLIGMADGAARPFEGRTQEEVARQRLERAKQLAAWPTKELMQRYVTDAGATANACLEKTEDTIKLLQELGLEGARQAAASSMVAVLREHHNAVGQFFTKSEVVSKHGLDAMGVVFEAQSTVQGLSSEQEKALTKLLKEKQEDGGGKWKGKRALPYLVPAPAPAQVASATTAYQQSGAVWGQGGRPVNQGWYQPQTGWHQQLGQGRPVQQQYIQGGGVGRGGGRAANMQR
jgi:hypothetical protein